MNRATHWTISQGSSIGRVLAHTWQGAKERARAIGFDKPESVVLDPTGEIFNNRKAALRAQIYGG